MAALRRRLEQTVSQQNVQTLLNDAALREASKLARVIDVNADIEADHVLGIFHWLRYQALPIGSDKEDLDRAVWYLEPVYRAQPEAVPEELHSVYEQFDREEQEQRASQGGLGGNVTALLEALMDNEGDEHEQAALRGTALLLSYRQNGQLPLLREAVDLFRSAAAAVPDDDPGMATHLANLGVALQMLFERTGDTAVLAEKVASGRKAVDVSPADDPELAGRLDDLAEALRELSERTGDANRMAESVDVARAAIAVTSNDHPDRPARLLQLGLALLTIFERTGDTDTLTESVDLSRQAVAATPENDTALAARLSGLGITLLRLYERTGELAVLTEAVQAGRDAVAATPSDHVKREVIESNLGVALFRLFERTQDSNHLAEAVQAARGALAATPDHHPARARNLTHLAIALLQLSERTGDPEGLAEAIRVGREAVTVSRDDDPDLSGRLTNLGVALEASLALEENAEHLTEARQAYRRAGNNTAAEPIVRIIAFRQSALLAGPDDAGRQEALTAVEEAVALLPQLTPRALARGDREHRLEAVGALAGVAAAVSLDAGRAERAAELLEATRGVLVADLVDARSSDLGQLRSRAPELAAAFEDLRHRREALDRRDAATAGRELTEARRGAQAEWAQLIGRIRAVEGFAGFLDTPDIGALTAQAADGPIVYIFANSGQRSDAVILTGDPGRPVRTVRLGLLTEEAAAAQANRLLTACRDTGNPVLPLAARITAQKTILDVLAWLWDVVTEPVLAELGYFGADRDWPRVWWCPVGVLGYLPLHAAGHHDDPSRTVLDRVVSSYTPTVRALAYARSHPPRSATGTVVIAVPDAPGTPTLNEVGAEADTVTAFIPGARRPAHPTRDQVLAALAASPIAHFACHGIANWAEPGRSSLILYDHQTAPLTVADISARYLSGALAYLSACDTTVSSPTLTDEAIHLTGAFHLAGYQSVVGTLWPIDDRAAHQLTTDFYRHLTRDGTAPPDTGRTAHALHQAVRNQRARYGAAPTLWAAYTHTGV
ncbi:hypothetical protein GCM10009733_049080 [Nonomuraea maheshkhaliensis]|uniref:CHAT domain-containing protein n=1 Tax=Nonomuraea maheshkhaliensis TaxID=419590 RepID=A0ABN2FHJ1_9ACTN